MAFVLGGIYLVVRTRSHRRAATPRGWVPVPGTVVDYELVQVPHPGEVYRALAFPVVRYRLQDGSEHTFRSGTTRDSGYYPTGQGVTVLTDPADPRRAQLESEAGTRVALGTIHLVLGSVLVLVGLAMVGVTAALLVVLG